METGHHIKPKISVESSYKGIIMHSLFGSSIDTTIDIEDDRLVELFRKNHKMNDIVFNQDGVCVGVVYCRDCWCAKTDKPQLYVSELQGTGVDILQNRKFIRDFIKKARENGYQYIYTHLVNEKLQQVLPLFGFKKLDSETINITKSNSNLKDIGKRISSERVKLYCLDLSDSQIK